jgi:hypothetical protein
MLAPSAAASQATLTSNLIKAWAKRRTWTRTDTARWIDDRSESALAWLRRQPGTWPVHSKKFGYWLKEHDTRRFDAAHRLLSKTRSDVARDALHVGQVLP